MSSMHNQIVQLILGQEPVTVSASYAESASLAQDAISASFATSASHAEYADNADFAITASYVQLAESASFAITASYVINGGFDTPNTLFVDNVNGDDGSGQRTKNTKPFATIQAAIDASSVNDKIVIYPGHFAEDIVIPHDLYFDAINTSVNSITLNGGQILGKFNKNEYGHNYVYVRASGSNSNNGDRLKEAYTYASASNPCGNVKSDENRFTIILDNRYYAVDAIDSGSVLEYIDFYGNFGTITGSAVVFGTSSNNIFSTINIDTSADYSIGAYTSDAVLENVNSNAKIGATGTFNGRVYAVKCKEFDISGNSSNGYIADVLTTGLTTSVIKGCGSTINNCKFTNVTVTDDISGELNNLIVDGEFKADNDINVTGTIRNSVFGKLTGVSFSGDFQNNNIQDKISGIKTTDSFRAFNCDYERGIGLSESGSVSVMKGKFINCSFYNDDTTYKAQKASYIPATFIGCSFETTGSNLVHGMVTADGGKFYNNSFYGVDDSEAIVGRDLCYVYGNTGSTDVFISSSNAIRLHFQDNYNEILKTDTTNYVVDDSFDARIYFSASLLENLNDELLHFTVKSGSNWYLESTSSIIQETLGGNPDISLDSIQQRCLISINSNIQMRNNGIPQPAKVKREILNSGSYSVGTYTYNTSRSYATPDLHTAYVDTSTTEVNLFLPNINSVEKLNIVHTIGSNDVIIRDRDDNLVDTFSGSYKTIISNGENLFVL